MNKKNLILLTLFLLLILVGCEKGANKKPLKLKDFYFYKMDQGKELKLKGDEFTQGEATKVKLFVENFGYQKVKGGFRVSVLQMLKLINSEGSVVYYKVEVDETVVLKKLPPHLLFINNIVFTKSLPAGDYTLLFEIIDRIKGMKLKVKKKVHIKALI